MKRKVKAYIPIFNSIGLFATSDNSWHGNPDPVKCPKGQSRKSLALYYYTDGRPKGEISPFFNNSTIFKYSLFVIFSNYI